VNTIRPTYDECEPQMVDAESSPSMTVPKLTLHGISRRGLLTTAGLAIATGTLGANAVLATPATAAPLLLRSGAWGGHANGRIPLSSLSTVPWNTARRLRSDAVQALGELNKAFRAAFGRDLPLNDAYRDYAGQVEARNYWCSQGNCGFAAVPGTSNHGWALAIDIGVPRTAWTNPIYVWMKGHAAAYGWTHPAWAEPTGAHPEAWHWEYTGSNTPPSTQPEDIVPIYHRRQGDYTAPIGTSANTRLYFSSGVFDMAAGAGGAGLYQVTTHAYFTGLTPEKTLLLQYYLLNASTGVYSGGFAGSFPGVVGGVAQIEFSTMIPVPSGNHLFVAARSPQGGVSQTKVAKVSLNFGNV